MTDPATDAVRRERRVLAVGCLALLAFGGLGGLLIHRWMFAGDAAPPIPGSAREVGGEPPGEARSPRQVELEIRVLDAEQRLGFARAQMRSTIDPGERAGWAAEVERLEQEVARLRARLSREDGGR